MFKKDTCTLSREEIEVAVKAKKEELGITDPAQKGQFVGAVMKDLKGNRATDGLLSAEPPEQYQQLKHQLSNPQDGDRCPLLLDDCCLLYQARPIICRTHGLPILITEEAGRRVDVCPLNCKGMERMPGGALIDLERLNSLLVSVNVLYLREFGIKLPTRTPLASLGEMFT